MHNPLGIYISVPFCKAKCTFCNFASDAYAPTRMQNYVDRLCREISTAHTLANLIPTTIPSQIDTLYFGGGTPSLLSAAQFRQIFCALRNQFSLASDAEITLECAPGQLAEETLAELLRQGINRVSLGVQSFIDRESAAVGRLHTAEQCLAEIARIRAAGIADISLDLIVGLPHQTASSWYQSVEQVIDSGLPHASVYMLEVDDESRLGREMLQQGSRYHADAVPSADAAADWYQYACESFDAAGLGQYEISNFARSDHQSRHNLKYWQRQPYLGFGLDAHSMLHAGNKSARFANTDDLDLYLADIPAVKISSMPQYSPPLSPPEIESISHEAAFEESLFLGLRLNAGVDLIALRNHFGGVLLDGTMAAIKEVCDAGLLETVASRVRLTPRGRLASNEVFSRLLLTAV
jgi:oxygen-independent coproporphyrinogen III oxidase